MWTRGCGRTIMHWRVSAARVCVCLQPSFENHHVNTAPGHPSSTQGWNCLFIISIIVGHWKMTLLMCREIPKVISLSNCVLMASCLMGCLGPVLLVTGCVSGDWCLRRVEVMNEVSEGGGGLGWGQLRINHFALFPFYWRSRTERCFILKNQILF